MPSLVHLSAYRHKHAHALTRTYTRLIFSLYLRTRQTLRHAIPSNSYNHTLCALTWTLNSELCYLRHSHHLILYSHSASSQNHAFSSSFLVACPRSHSHPRTRPPTIVPSPCSRLPSYVQSCFIHLLSSPSRFPCLLFLKSKVYFLVLRFSSLWARGRRRRIHLHLRLHLLHHLTLFTILCGKT